MWWITFALGHVQYSVIFMMAQKWIYCDYFKNSQHKNDGGNEISEYIFLVLIYYWLRQRSIRKWHINIFSLNLSCSDRKSLAGVCLMIHFFVLSILISDVTCLNSSFADVSMSTFRTFFPLKFCWGFIWWRISNGF